MKNGRRVFRILSIKNRKESKQWKRTKKQKKLKRTTRRRADIFDTEEDRNLTIDDIENAPDDPGELFSEPPTLDIDFDEEPTDDELKLEEMDVDALNDDLPSTI